MLLRAGAVAHTAATPQRPWHNFEHKQPSFLQRALGAVLEFAESRDVSSRLFACSTQFRDWVRWHEHVLCHPTLSWCQKQTSGVFTRIECQSVSYLVC